MASATDAARTFLRRCSVHYCSCVSKPPLEREVEDKELWARLADAPDTIRTEEGVTTLLENLKSHKKAEVRTWAAWAGKPVVRHMAVPHVSCRLDNELLLTDPASTNMQESTHHSNPRRLPPGSLLNEIARDQALHVQTTRDFFSAGSGGSHQCRPLNDANRCTQAEKRTRRQRKRRLENDTRHDAAETEKTDDGGSARGPDHSADVDVDREVGPDGNAGVNLSEGAGSKGQAHEGQRESAEATRGRGGRQAGARPGGLNKASSRTCASSTPGPAAQLVLLLTTDHLHATPPFPRATLAAPAAPVSTRGGVALFQ